MTTSYQETLTDNGQSTAREFTGDWQLSLTDDFGGGTAKVQFSEDGGSTWADYPNEDTHTEATALVITMTSGTQWRVDLSGSTSPNLVVSWRKV